MLRTDQVTGGLAWVQRLTTLTGELNSVIRGTANYFAPTFSRCGRLFRGLDRWIRMRIRCMKFKRKSRADNGRMRLQQFQHRGLLSLSDLRPLPL